MKKLFAFLFVLVFAIPIIAQTRDTNIPSLRPRISTGSLTALERKHLARTIEQTNMNTTDVTTNETNIAAITDDTATWTNILQDSLGWQIVDAATYGDSVTDATAHIQDKIDAADGGPVFFPAGSYILSDSIYFNTSPRIFGPSGEREGYQGAAVLIQTVDKPIFYIDSTTIDNEYGTGGSIENITFNGENDQGYTNQHGIVINANKRWLFKRNNFVGLGGHGIKLGDDWNVTTVTIEGNAFRLCGLAQIYGRGSTIKQVNAVDIIDNHIAYGLMDGVDVIGIGTHIIRNVIEYNDSAGIVLDARDMGTTTVLSRNTVIKGNYIEDNEGGEIFINYYRDGGTTLQLHYGVTIEDNILWNATAYTSGWVDALITVQEDPDSDGSGTMYNLNIGLNYYYTSESNPYVDLGSDVQSDSRVWIPDDISGDAVSTYFPNLGISTKYYRGGNHPGMQYGPSGGTAFGAGNLARCIYLLPSSNVDWSANPQIENAPFEGFTVTFINLHASNTVTWDDGDGLRMEGQFVQSQWDQIEFQYLNGEWVERFRKNN